MAVIAYRAEPEPVTVTLEWHEIETAVSIGSRRHISALTTGRRSTATNGEWDAHALGALAEMAVAKYLGKFWSGSIGRIDTADVGPYQVRATWRANGCLLLHGNDADDDAFILVTGGPRVFQIRGWVYGKQGKDGRFWCDPNGSGRYAYFVPQSDLWPITDLPNGDIPF